MFGRGRRNSRSARSTFRSVWITSIWTKTPLSHKDNGILLDNHGEIWLRLCSEMQCLSISCEFHTSASWIIAPKYHILTIWRMWIGYCGSTTEVFWWTSIHLGSNWLLFKMSWSFLSLKEVKKKNVIYHFGIPYFIITNNGKPFYNKLMNKISDLFGVKQRKSSMYYAANGLAEAFNKTLCNLLKKVIS